MIDDDELHTQTLTLGAPSTSYSYSADYGAIPSISATDITIGNISVTNGGTGYTLGTGLQTPNTVWTTSGTGTSYNWSAVGANIKPSATISLKGEDADIDLNGKSMKAWMEKVEERLNILTVNHELEKEWDDLRKLGEKYRKLEKKCKEKAEVWNKLKKL